MKFCRFGFVCKLVFILLGFIFCYSCSPVVKLAKEYVRKQDTIPVLILAPEVLIKNDLRFQKRNISLHDSLMLSESKILKGIEDTLVFPLIFENLKDDLKAANFKVFDNSTMAEFMLEKKDAYIINCVQLEIDEFDTPLQESAQFDTTTYYEDFLLNTISINIWFEISMLNNTSEPTQLLFYSSSIKDRINGGFRKSLLGNDIRYVYKRSDISIDDVYSLATWFGVKNASNFFDYFMNQYVYVNYIGNPARYKYFHFDKSTGKYYPAKTDRFTFINSDQK